jgi:hypothetical protein
MIQWAEADSYAFEKVGISDNSEWTEAMRPLVAGLRTKASWPFAEIWLTKTTPTLVQVCLEVPSSTDVQRKKIDSTARIARDFRFICLSMEETRGN